MRSNFESERLYLHFFVPASGCKQVTMLVPSSSIMYVGAFVYTIVRVQIDAD